MQALHEKKDPFFRHFSFPIDDDAEEDYEENDDEEAERRLMKRRTGRC